MKGKVSCGCNVDRAKCVYCGCCVGLCPANAIWLDETVVVIDDEKCVKCGWCVRGCPVGAIRAEWWSQ